MHKELLHVLKQKKLIEIQLITFMIILSEFASRAVVFLIIYHTTFACFSVLDLRFTRNVSY